MVGTIGTIYGVETRDDTDFELRAALQQDLDLGAAVALLIFFVFALQCMSTVAVMRRETGGGGGPSCSSSTCWPWRTREHGPRTRSVTWRLHPGAARRKSGSAAFRVAVALSGPLAAIAGCAPDREPEKGVAGSVIDDRGRPHEVSAPRTRIVSLIPAVTETLAAIGAADLLVARTRYDEAAEVAELPSVAAE